ncbi:hypothetical protein [Pseudoalteromonas piscicida]|uniref:hypothetical protein n=1 Tax=Pseudoalteromonas piscicida TaxID=43662 RepID=UPI0027E4B413|nr:hypothetical protein [Pseudoalteromonas piscicida]WMO15700.1 hypothetical protein NI376_09035 [Pseudoalteromonas piscicida]
MGKELRWDNKLYFRLNPSRACDLNRLFYFDCPGSSKIKKNTNNHPFVFERVDKVKELGLHFSRIIDEGGSTSQLYNLFYAAVDYFKWVDSNNHLSFSILSVEKYCEFKLRRALSREIKNTTFSKIRSHLSSLFSLLDLSTECFKHVPSLPKNDGEPFEAYSRSDLNKLLPILRAIFKQTSKQFLSNPKFYIKAHASTYTMSFAYKGRTYKLRSGITKMMIAATYLLSFYTFANSSSLLSLTRPNTAKFENNEAWYSMPTFKRRAFKVIHIEIAEHDLLIPKYSISFFNTLLEVSKLINNTDNSLLIQTCTEEAVRPLAHYDLTNFNKSYLRKHFNLTDDRNRELRPQISRFRKTGSELAFRFQGAIGQGELLNNTPNVRNKHYSTGNKHENLSMLQEIASIREQQAKTRGTAQSAQKDLNIKVLSIDDYYKIDIPLSKTAHGGMCQDPFGKRSEKFTKKASNTNSALGEKIACADLLNCFGCEHQVIIQSVDDIWCLFSFKSCLEESIFFHLDEQHFNQNFTEVIQYIEINIIPNLDKSIVKQAEMKLDELGRHPLWQDANSMMMAFGS